MKPPEPRPLNLPVALASSAPDSGRDPSPKGRRTPSGFAAQLIGQPGQKRGLKGGPETLKAARTAYLEAEYSGPADRRPPKGIVRKTEI